MTAVRFLELAGGPMPQLRAEHVELDALEAALAAGPRLGARFRLLELTAPEARRLDWAAIQRLRHKALQLLLNVRVLHRLQGHEIVRLEVSGQPRELRSTIDALRAQALIAAPMIVLDVEMPDAPDAGEVDELVQAWEQLLTDDAPAGRRRIERAPPQPAHAAAAAEDLLATLLADADRFRDSASVGRALARNPQHENPKMVTTRARQRGQIFGAWDGNAYRYPTFQFDADGQPRAEMPALIEVLPRDADGRGRDAALWLFAPDAALDERTPAEVFVEDPQRVIALARRRREGGDALD